MERTTRSRRAQLNSGAKPSRAQKMTASKAANLSNGPVARVNGARGLDQLEAVAIPPFPSCRTLYHGPVSHELGPDWRLLNPSDFAAEDYLTFHSRHSNDVICRATKSYLDLEGESSLCFSKPRQKSSIQGTRSKIQLKKFNINHKLRGLHVKLAILISSLALIGSSLSLLEARAEQIYKQPIASLHDNIGSSLVVQDNTLQAKIKPEDLSEQVTNRAPRRIEEETKTTTTAIATNTIAATSESATQVTATDSSDHNELAGAENDDDHAQGCEGLSANESAEGESISDAKRLVNLQTCLQTKVRKQVLGATRAGMEAFDKLSLSGGCTASLVNLMNSLSELKSFAFKFLDASAKIPSGVMYGLLSDFGDFDECMAAKSQPGIAPELEAEQGVYSGKYCLASIKLNYHVKLAPNQTTPDGIIADGLLWDDLVRNYWISDSPKGVHMGICLPSRCTNDDIEQLYQLMADAYNFKGQIIGCQDSLELKHQSRPDLVQRLILGCLLALATIVLLGSLADRYELEATVKRLAMDSKVGSPDGKASLESFIGTIFQVLVCFSLTRNWRIFMGTRRAPVPVSGWYSPRLISLASNPSVEQMTEHGTEVGSSLNEASLSCESAPVSPQVGRPSHLAIPMAAHRISQLTVKISPEDSIGSMERYGARLSHLSGLRLLMIIWITIGHSFLYPSANNYQHYRSIINMNITRDSVWFATTNFTLGIDSLLYIAGLVFVYKSARGLQAVGLTEPESSGCQVLRLISKRVLRFWPTYLTVIGLAIIVPLLSDGPMWPEMVTRRLGESCRQNWWSNLLFINNFLTESEICLPSSWFVSVLMQLFVVGTIIVLIERKYSMRLALVFLGLLLLLSCACSFVFAYIFKLRAPIIRMDESFVLDVDIKIWRLYTNVLNSLGPFLVGMLGGYILLRARGDSAESSHGSREVAGSGCQDAIQSRLIQWASRFSVDLLVLAIMASVLSLVLKQDYDLVSGSFYWSLHRIGWAIVTGYVIHNCAIGRWRLLHDLLSLSSFIPLSRLIFIAYLVYPIYIHMHSGMVRDGLHVSIYNMFSIYITRLVLTFATAAFIHLTVELPFCSIEEIYLNRLVNRINERSINSSKLHPLMKVAPVVMANRAKAPRQDGPS